MARTGGLHESFDRSHRVKASSDRVFGVTIGAVLIVLSAVRLVRHRDFDAVTITLATVAVAALALGLLAPRLLRPLNRAWTLLGLLLYRITNPMVLAVIFFGTITPIGFVMRLTGADPLRLRRGSSSAATYWISRDPPGPSPETMGDQF